MLIVYFYKNQKEDNEYSVDPYDYSFGFRSDNRGYSILHEPRVVSKNVYRNTISRQFTLF